MIQNSCHDVSSDFRENLLVGQGRVFRGTSRHTYGASMLHRGLLADIAHGMAGVDSLLYTKTDFQVWSPREHLHLSRSLSSPPVIHLARFRSVHETGPVGIAVTRTRGIARVDTL